MIQSKWNIDPYMLNKYLERFPDDPNTNNCRRGRATPLTVTLHDGKVARVHTA